MKEINVRRIAAAPAVCRVFVYYHPVRQLCRTIKYTPTSTLLVLQTHEDTPKKQQKVVSVRGGRILVMGVTGNRNRDRIGTTEANFVVNPPGRAIYRLSGVAVVLLVLSLKSSSIDI